MKSRSWQIAVAIVALGAAFAVGRYTGEVHKTRTWSRLVIKGPTLPSFPMPSGKEVNATAAAPKMPVKLGDEFRAPLLEELLARAEKGDMTSQFWLGNSYYLGDGAPKFYIEAVRWWRKAAEQGDKDAQYNLGVCYHNGEGVTRDVVEAYKWMNLALAQRTEQAANCLALIEKEMTNEQISDAQRRSVEFKPRNVP